MSQYWNNLNEREKKMVLGAALCIVFYCYYFFLYAPLAGQVKQKSMQLVEKTETLEWMKSIKKTNTLSGKKQSIANGQLLTILAKQLKESTFPKFPYQLQQTGSGDIQITFDMVPFIPFMKWLTEVNERYLITIKQLEVSHSDLPGVTKLMIIISPSS